LIVVTLSCLCCFIIPSPALSGTNEYLYEDLGRLDRVPSAYIDRVQKVEQIQAKKDATIDRSVASVVSVEPLLSVSTVNLRDSIESSLPTNSHWSFSAVTLDRDKQRIDIGNAKHSSLIPASLIKLLTTAAILDLDANDKISLDTAIYTDGERIEGEIYGNLYINGAGNAFLSEKDFRAAAEEIRSKGITAIRGDIVADTSLFSIIKNLGLSGPAYSSPGALGLDLHTAAITISGSPSKVKVEPGNDAVKIIFRNGDKRGIRQIDDLTYEITGSLSDSAEMRKRFSLQNPALYAAGTLIHQLQKRGVRVSGTVKNAKKPEHAKVLAIIPSKALSEMVKDTNQNSLNVAADNLLLLLGARKNGAPGTADKGIMAVRSFLNKLGVDDKDLKMFDGSGLSSDNLVTSAMMVEFLAKAAKEPWFESFYASLPRAGTDGTLRGLHYRNDHVRAKTGRLHNAYCLAGYVERVDNSRMAFTYMLNVPGADLSGEKATAALLSRLAEGEL